MTVRRADIRAIAVAAMLVVSSTALASTPAGSTVSDYHASCGGTGVKALDIDLRNSAYWNYTSFHVEPTGLARWASVSGSTMISELWGCTPWVYNYQVHSYAGIEDQLGCHDVSPGGYATGPTWDLEGHRRANRNLFHWVWYQCNW